MWLIVEYAAHFFFWVGACFGFLLSVFVLVKIVTQAIFQARVSNSWFDDFEDEESDL